MSNADSTVSSAITRSKSTTRSKILEEDDNIEAPEALNPPSLSRQDTSTLQYHCKIDGADHLPGIVEKIVSDRVVPEVLIRTAAEIVTPVITTGSVKRMNLKEATRFCGNQGHRSVPQKGTVLRLGA